ncbi:carboxymuconolactone decarboxylase family protein [Streptomyces sp. NBC_00271]|uniref:carboxymuconolactone decarboxylase family protein n=1 Tax=Streptomyces sp. NBC_00271 TaxID=2975697 RepID=UPI002E2BC120|nr:carboxymuconolactone decarboxylase family protein [Streptomyces sp. NBC_00271]
MSGRMRLGHVAPEGYQALIGLDKYVQANVDDQLLNLVRLRASVLNGCTYCVDLHSHDLLKAGESTQRVMGVAVWREFPFLSSRERAALMLTDAATRLGEGGVPDEVWAGVEQAFTEKEIADLILAIGTINLWNRIGVSTGMQPSLRK